MAEIGLSLRALCKGGIELMSEDQVVLTDVRISFGRMVMIILKLMLASIPAVLLLYAVIFGIMLIFGVGIGGCAALLSQ